MVNYIRQVVSFRAVRKDNQRVIGTVTSYDNKTTPLDAVTKIITAAENGDTTFDVEVTDSED